MPMFSRRLIPNALSLRLPEVLGGATRKAEGVALGTFCRNQESDTDFANLQVFALSCMTRGLDLRGLHGERRTFQVRRIGL